jgi:serine/threonine-protein kinase
MGRPDTDPGRWALVHELLGHALELDPDERGAFLAERCADDAELRGEVESLIRASEESDDYFGDLADRAGITLSADTRDGSAPSEAESAARASAPGRLGSREEAVPDLIGRRVGQYDVLEWLGKGGMASVFLAERDGDGFTQRVALKVVSRKVSDPLIQRRSNEERRILARLEHRNIARLIDGGVTPDGHPFYAMEFVEGTDVVSYCDKARLSVEERIRLFLEVCAPVQFAHERLIVHCDLKPGNIFVTPEGHVKLLDFGIARLIDPESVGSDVTGLWFTPAYASPEQVRRERPGTHSDVYSLGVLLYQLLSGHRPYRFGTALQEEIMRTVGEVVPPLPSEVVSLPGQRTVDGEREAVSAVETCASRRSTPDRMRKRLRGDLDAIVMKALAKDPAERYSTTEQLAADLRRHLANEPVMSRAITPRYRVAKFIRRNRGAVTAAGLLLVAVAGGVSATLWQASRANSAARAAEGEAEKAALVADLMRDLFRLSDPSESAGNAVTARDILDQGAERIRTEFDDQPVVQAELLSEVARVYDNLGLYARAEPLVEQALGLRIAAFGGLSAEASESLIHLGVLKSNLGLPNEAIELLSRAIDIREPRVARPDALLVEAKATLGWAVQGTGRYDQAAQLFTEALDEQVRIDPAAPEIADLKFGLASAYHDSGMLEESDSIFHDVLDDVNLSSRPTPHTLSALRRVGMMHRLREEYREADEVLAGAVEMGLQLYGPEHGMVLAAQQEYALNLVGLGRWAEAERVFRAALDVSTSLLGPGHNVTARLQEGLGTTLEDLGRYDEAVEYLKLSLQETVLRHQNRDHPGVVASLVSVARALALAGRYTEARDYLTQSEAMNTRLGNPDNVHAVSIHGTMGIIATAERRYPEAETHFARAIELADALLDRPSHRFRLGALSEYASMLVSAGRAREAVPILEEVRDLRIESLGEPHPLIDRTRAMLRGANRS